MLGLKAAAFVPNSSASIVPFSATVLAITLPASIQGGAQDMSASLEVSPSGNDNHNHNQVWAGRVQCACCGALPHSCNKSHPIPSKAHYFDNDYKPTSESTWLQLFCKHSPPSTSSILAASAYFSHTSRVIKGGSITTQSNVLSRFSGSASGWLKSYLGEETKHQRAQHDVLRL